MNVLDPVVAKLPVFIIVPNEDVATNFVLPVLSPTQTYPCCKDAVKLPIIFTLLYMSIPLAPCV